MKILLLLDFINKLLLYKKVNVHIKKISTKNEKPFICETYLNYVESVIVKWILEDKVDPAVENKSWEGQFLLVFISLTRKSHIKSAFRTVPSWIKDKDFDKIADM